MSFVNVSILWLLLPLFSYLYLRKKPQSFVQNLRWAVVVLIILALARPVIPQKMTQERGLGHAVVLAIDLSVSMQAKDIAPTRLEASKLAIKAFLDHSLYERIALIGFTVNPLLLSPPTTDHELIKMALSNIHSEYILTKGTNLKKLFEKVAELKDEEKKVILLSDGGDEVLDESLRNFLQEEQIKLFAIGMATAQGSSVEQADGTLLKNREGHIVVSKLNGGLENLAIESGGAFVHYGSAEQVVSDIISWLESQGEVNEASEQQSKAYFELAVFPLTLAIILFFLSATRFSKKLLALLFLLGLNVQAEEYVKKENWGEGTKKFEPALVNGGLFDDYYLYSAYEYYKNKNYMKAEAYVYKMKQKNLEATLLLAHTLYKQEKYKAAKSLLKRIKSSDRKIKQQVYYELGNCEAKLTYMNKAKEYYVKALQLGHDEDALHNLEWVIRYNKEHASKAGYTNPSSAQKSKEKSDSVEGKEEKASGEKKKSAASTGGTGAKKSKSSTVKVTKSEEKSESQRRLSSKAYDLINEGYINEKKPW
jgi:Ca-activated chloride channel family protein